MTKHKKKKGAKKHSAGFLKKQLSKLFIKNPKTRFNARQIIKKLRIANTKDAVDHSLKTLESESVILHVKDGKYRLNPKAKGDNLDKFRTKKNYIGKVDMTRSGAAYVLIDELKQDVYVPAQSTKTAMNGDLVKVAVIERKGNRRPEGKIVDIVERSVSQVVARLSIEKSFATAHTSHRTSIPEVYINKGNLGGARDKDYVLVKITEWSKSQNKAVWGKVIQVIEDHNPAEIAMNTILVNSGFDLQFPDAVLKEVAAIEDVTSEEEISRRRDFREILTFTIDPATAKDFDDALSFQELEDDIVEVGIHIADVTHYLKEGTQLDKEALDRSTSVYLVDRVIPMLPEKLSNHLCSLVPHEDRYVFSAVFKFNKEHKVIDRWFGKSIIHSDHRFAYEEAQEILEGKESDISKPMLKMAEIARTLRKNKFKQGAINFESDEVRFELDENGKPIGVYVKERKEANMLIEDYMLLANREVAKYIHKKGAGKEIPFPYRIHDEPNPEKLEDFVTFASAMGVKMDVSTQKKLSKSFSNLSAAAKEDDQLKMLEPLAIRTMSKAVYSTNNIGHYGLAFQYYGHFTSPIRRYADVLVHRILFKNLKSVNRLDKDALEAKCDHISSQERKAMKAERESIKYKQVEFLLDKIGEVFPARVSGMIERGIFVELLESRAEGLIGFDRFKESYILSANKLSAKGTKTGTEIKMGDKLTVKVLSANLDNMQIELEIIPKDQEA